MIEKHLSARRVGSEDVPYFSRAPDARPLGSRTTRSAPQGGGRYPSVSIRAGRLSASTQVFPRYKHGRI